MNFIIYKIVNNINGKIYIGQTRVGLEKRWYMHKAMSKYTGKNASKSYLHNAIRKYGENNFTIEILDDSSTDNKTLSLLEMHYINKFKSYNPNIGYNICLYRTEIPTDYPFERRYKMSKNKHLDKSKGKSIYSGVFYCNDKNILREKRWQCRISFMKKRKAKRFSNEIESAEAYDKIFLYLMPECPPKNFPEKINEYLKINLAEFYSEFMENRCIKKKII